MLDLDIYDSTIPNTKLRNYSNTIRYFTEMNINWSEININCTEMNINWSEMNINFLIYNFFS